MHKFSAFSEEERKIKRFVFFAQCFLVEGAKRTAIYDLNRNKYDFIPNDLAELITKCEGKSKNDILSIYGAENESTIEEYFSYLEEEEFIFWCDEDEVVLFPKIDLSWDYPAHITNSIIDIDENSNHDFKLIFKQLAQLNCQYVQFRSFVIKPLSFWEEIVQLAAGSIVKRVEIFTPYANEYAWEGICDLYKQFPRIGHFIVHSTPVQVCEIQNPKQDSNVSIAFVSDELKSNKDCHQNHFEYFSPNLQMYSESQSFNPYFNRKLSIDVDGAIKNCNSVSTSFGNVNDIGDGLLSVIRSKDFQRLWTITKDQIKVCQDCEFRYMCMDSREPIRGEDGLYFHQSTCAYDPYICEWND